MPDPASVRFRGPLVPYWEGFWTWLLVRGYSPLTGMNLLRLAAHVSRWLEGESLDLDGFTPERVIEFAACRRELGHTAYHTPRALQPLLCYLRELGVAPPPSVPPVDETPSGRLLLDYSTYLVEVRGIQCGRAKSYVHFAQRLLAGRPPTELSTLSADEVVSFVLSQVRRKDGGFWREPATAIRSLLSFLTSRNLIRAELANCVPAVAQWRLAGLPQALEPHEVQAVLSAYAPNSAQGRRDGAIVSLLVRLGLRAGEAASLRLDDIDWRGGEILVRGKGGREDRMPLPLDVGERLAVYLTQGRPASSHRHVFLGILAPFTPLGAHGVVGVATQALRRAGVKTGGAHRLRHTAATQLLRGGASLAEVAHVLRHRHLATTAIYAKVDDASLRALVRPWPGGAA